MTTSLTSRPERVPDEGATLQSPHGKHPQAELLGHWGRVVNFRSQAAAINNSVTEGEMNGSADLPSQCSRKQIIPDPGRSSR